MAVSLKAMEYYCAAVRQGSIARAAAQLNIAASAVATAVDQVEHSFDLTLVTRQRSRGIEPNASGRLVLQKFERLLEDYRSVMSEGAELKHALRGTLRIGYYAPIAPAFLPNILQSFVPEDNEVSVHLEECDNDTAQEGLLNGTYDAILFVSEDVRPAIEFDVLLQAPAYCLVSEGHPFAAQGRVSMAQLSQEPMVVLNRAFAASYYQSLFDTFAPDVAIVAYANSTEMVRSLVSSGRGCAILNMQPLTQDSYCGRKTVSLPITENLPPLTLSIGYQKTKPRRLVRSFVDACQAYFSTQGSHQCIVASPKQQ